MKKQLGMAMALSLGLLTANTALASDAVLGALLGGGAGAIVGRSIGGRNGTIVGGALGAAAGAAIASERHPAVERRVEYAPSYGYYAPPPPPQQVYYAQPVRVVQQPVYYVHDEHGGYQGREGRHHRHHDGDRRDYERGYRY